MRDSLNSILDDLANNPTLSIATYIRPDQPVQWTDRDILVPIEKVRVIGGVIRKFRGDLRIRYAVENGRFWLVALTEEKFDVQPRSARGGAARCRAAVARARIGASQHRPSRPAEHDTPLKQRRQSYRLRRRRDRGCEILGRRSEEHTSELQSLMRISYAVFCLKKKTTQQTEPHNDNKLHMNNNI